MPRTLPEVIIFDVGNVLINVDHLAIGIGLTDPLHFEYLCKTFPILGRMEDTIFSYRVGKRKPASEIFACALKRAGVHPHQAWYVDDISDFVDAAERMGLRGIPYRTAPELADALGVG